MTAWPIILRELRAEARQPFIIRLRLLSAGIMLALFVQVLMDYRLDLTLLGQSLFPYLHTTLFFAIWLIVPLLTADCLARERRDDTLILLLLTRLTPGGIVSAKICAHALRAATLVLAAFPLLCVPFTFGGLGTTEATVAVLMDANAFLLALGIGLMVSAAGRRWASVMAMAELLGMFGCVVFCSLYYAAYQLYLVPLMPGSMWVTPGSLRAGVEQSWYLITGANRVWQTTLASALPGVDEVWRTLLWVQVEVSLLLVVLAWKAAAVWLRYAAVERPATAPRWQWQRLFCTPQFATAIWFWLRRRELERNPIFWLQHYSWRGRATQWAWALCAAGCMRLLSEFKAPEFWFEGQALFALFLFVAMALAAAGSWRQERRNGVWELLLITPISAWQLVGGRVRGLYRHFLGALIVWMVCLWLLSPPGFFNDAVYYLGLLGLGIFFVVPLVGQDSALNLSSYWTAWIATSIPVIFVPGLVFFLARRDDWELLVLSGFILFIMAAMAGFGLYRQLALRQYEPRHRPSQRQLRKLAREVQRMGPPVVSEQ